VLLLSEGVEQSGEQASFAFHFRSAVTALSAPEPIRVNHCDYLFAMGCIRDDL